jgi:outer membrane protein OmpA-like peptidoglycan-associated protein
MSNPKVCFSAWVILSAVMLGSVHAAPLDAAFIVAQAPPESEHGKKPPESERGKKPPQRPAKRPPPQERRVQPPQQERRVQPPPQERRFQPPQERRVQPPPQERRVQPPQEGRQPPPPASQVQPPPSAAQPSAPSRQRQIQPPPSPGTQQPPPPQGGQQPVQRGANGAIGRPPKPAAPQQPVGKPAIAPSALKPPAPPPGSPAAQVQRAFVPPPAQDNARRLDDVRGARREVREGDRVMIEEPGRVIIREGGRTIIRHSDDDRFRWQARDVRMERRGSEIITVFDRPDGSRIYTVTDQSGRLLRRYRRTRDGHEIIIIDNHYSGPPRPAGYFVDLRPPVIHIPRERYIVDTRYARPYDIYYALWAAPVEHIERPYTLDEIRYSWPLLERMPRVDVDTVTFDTGFWEVTPDQVDRLAVIADGINRAVAADPREVFLIEGHTDTVGSDIDNLSLSDRRAESVALVLSQQFGVPAENLVTQGYGAHHLKVPTPGPSRANRRVTVRRITPLLTGQNEAVPLAPR